MLIKRITADIIDLLGTWMFGIGFLINLYLYYFKGKTLGLMVFNFKIYNKDNLLPTKYNLFIRFLSKYGGIFLLYLLSTLIGNLVTFASTYIFYEILKLSDEYAIYVFIIRIISIIGFFISILYFSYKKSNSFWREKYGKINI